MSQFKNFAAEIAHMDAADRDLVQQLLISFDMGLIDEGDLMEASCAADFRSACRDLMISRDLQGCMEQGFLEGLDHE